MFQQNIVFFLNTPILHEKNLGFILQFSFLLINYQESNSSQRCKLDLLDQPFTKTTALLGIIFTGGLAKKEQRLMGNIWHTGKL